MKRQLILFAPPGSEGWNWRIPDAADCAVGH